MMIYDGCSFLYRHSRTLLSGIHDTKRFGFPLGSCGNDEPPWLRIEVARCTGKLNIERGENKFFMCLEQGTDTTKMCSVVLGFKDGPDMEGN